MDSKDRLAIEGLFGKLAQIEANGQPRDAGAEAYIRERIAAQPSAPYYMAQTIVVQDQALEAAQQRIAELEAGAAERGRTSSSRVPSIRPAAARPGGAETAHTGAGGGFLAGAAQTAMGVAGGVLLANMLGGLFGTDAKAASEPQADNAAQDQSPNDQPAQDDAALEPAADDGGFDLGGFDGGGFDF